MEEPPLPQRLTRRLIITSTLTLCSLGSYILPATASAPTTTAPQVDRLLATAPQTASKPAEASIQSQVVATPTPTPIPPTIAATRPPAAVQAPPAAHQPSGADAWDGLLQQHFGANWQHAKRIMKCESGGNPGARGPVDSQGFQPIGLFQIKNFAGRPSTSALLNGATNISYAARMSGGGNNWKAWECK